MEVKIDYGFVLAHRPAVLPLQQAHVEGFEIAILRPTTGKDFGKKLFYPDVFSLTIAGFNLGSPDYLGMGIAVYPFINFPLNRSDDWQIHFRYGMGLG